MPDSTHFFVQTLITRVANDCSTAQARIRSAKDMGQVKRASEVHTNPMIRALPQVRQHVRSVHDAAEKRMDNLLDEHLKKLATCTTGAEIRAEHARLIRNEWGFLRGAFSRVYVRAEGQYQCLRHLADQLTVATAAAAAAEEEQDPSDDDEGSAPAP